jgi:hypothetical protein
MKKYQTLKQEIYDLDALPPEQQSVYEAVWNFYQQAPDWDTFTAFWLAQIDRLHPQLSRKDITETPLFKICEDMDARLAINQGYTRPGDYRDALQSIIEQKFPSRYAFCQTVGLDEGYLSRVLNKRQHISMKKLAHILDTLGYEVIIREKTDHPGATAPDTKREAITHVGDVP